MENDVARIVINEKQIQQKLGELSKKLTHDFKNKDCTFIAILNGSLVFLADLIRLVPFPIRLDTIDAASYGDSTSPKGEPDIIRQFKIDIEDRHVLVIDDIIDTGNTLKKVLNDIREYKPKTLKSCVLLNRSNRRQCNIQPEYSCFTIGNDFVVGYGLDYNNKYRNLPYIAVLKDEFYNHKSFHA